MGICSQNDPDNIRAALAAHGVGGRFAAVVGHADAPSTVRSLTPAAFLTCLDRWASGAPLWGPPPPALGPGALCSPPRPPHLGLREAPPPYLGDHPPHAPLRRTARGAGGDPAVGSLFFVVPPPGGGGAPEDTGAAAVVPPPGAGGAAPPPLLGKDTHRPRRGLFFVFFFFFML